MAKVPVINIAPLLNEDGDPMIVANQIGDACRTFGFFYIIGHGIDEGLQADLEDQSKLFFEQDLESKMRIRMALGGKAWRGFFPVGEELTSGKPDLKEGLYFGSELSQSHPKVEDGMPLHGANLFPDGMSLFREVVLNYMNVLTELGHKLMEGIALSLDLERQYFFKHFTFDPLTLFRIFHYPPRAAAKIDAPWGVGEHTDYGVLTILKQDEIGGLQVKTQSQWIDAPYIANSFICNIGDMLDKMTGGIYRSTPHRVLNKSVKSRYSFPFFFDPNFDVKIEPIPLDHLEISTPQEASRWDGADLQDFSGTYGDYVLAKVSQVFPQLRKDID